MARWGALSLACRRPRERGQGRAPARALSGAPRRRAVSGRAEPGGRRPGRARPARALRLPARRLDRDVRRPLRADRRPTTRARRPVATRRAAGAARAARGRERRARAARPLAARPASPASPTRCSPRSPSSKAARRPGRPRRRARRALRAPTAASSTGSGSGIAISLRRRACERLRGDLDAWHGEPVFVYGFEDLTAAEWSLLEALAGRAEVRSRFPTSRAGPRSRRCARTAEDLAALAGGRIEELPPRSHEFAAPALAHLERALFEPATPSDSDRGRRALPRRRGRPRDARARRRGAARAAPRAAPRPSRSRSSSRRSSAAARLARDGVRRASGSPTRSRRRVRLAATPLGHALLALLRFAWAGGGRRELYSFLRSPYSGIARPSVDFTEGRLRGRAIEAAARVEEETERLREAPLVALRELRAAPSPLEGVRALARVDAARRLRPRGAARGRAGASRPALASRRRPSLLDELAALEELGEPLGARRAARRARAGSSCRRRRPASRGGSRCSTCCGARTRRFEAVFVLGLEEGVAAAARRRLAVPRRRAAPRARRAPRAARPGQPRPLPLLHRLHARDPAALPRARGGDRRRLAARGEPVLARRRPRCSRPKRSSARPAGARSPSSPGRSRRRRPSASGCARSRGSRPTREARELALALAEANGWTRRLEPRARAPSTREPRLRNPVVLAAARRAHGLRRDRARALRRLLLGLVLRARRSTRRRSTPRPTRCCAARSPTRRSTRSTRVCRKELGVDRVTPETLEPALAFLARCLDEAFGSGVRLELGEVEAAELREGLRRDLERFVRDEAESPLALRAAAVRARVRHRPLGARAAARARARRRALRQRQDRPDRHRPAQRARDRPGLQVGQGLVLGAPDRRGAPAAGAALHARAARPRRDRAARRRLPGALRARGPRAGCCAPRRATSCRASRRTTTSTRTQFWGQVETARGRALARRARIRAGERRARPAGRRVPDLVRPLDDVPGGARLMNEQPARGGRGTRRGVRLGRRGYRQDGGARRALRARRLRRGARRRLGARDHLHAQGGGRAALPDPGGARRARPARPRARARRRLDLDDPRLLRAPAARASVRGRDRPALPRARRRAGGGAPRRGVRARARGASARRRSPSGCACSRPTAAAGCARC